MCDNNKIGKSSMRREFKQLYEMCPMTGLTLVSSQDIIKQCFKLINNFDEKYETGRFNELKSMSGWIKSYF
jgi:hypothetical protein